MARDEVTVTLRKVKYTVPASHPQYEACRQALYNMDWWAVPRILGFDVKPPREKKVKAKPPDLE